MSTAKFNEINGNELDRENSSERALTTVWASKKIELWKNLQIQLTAFHLEEIKADGRDVKKSARVAYCHCEC